MRFVSDPYEARLRKLIPGIAAYRASPMVLAPYLFRVRSANVETETFSTDRLGFRKTQTTGGTVDCDSWLELSDRALLLGGSVAFGTGATGDHRTVAARLSDRIGSSFLNLGINGVGSSHEVTAAQYFLQHARLSVILSGFNNLLAVFAGSSGRAPFAPEVGEGIVSLIGGVSFLDICRAIERRSGEHIQAPAAPATAREPIATEEAVEIAAAAYERDLRVVRKLARANAGIVFALQPALFCLGKRQDPTERELIALLRAHSPAERTKNWMERVPGAMPLFAERLAAICADLEIVFVDLNTFAYEGFCFIDPVHMTDRGYRLAADHIETALCWS